MCGPELYQKLGQLLSHFLDLSRFDDSISLLRSLAMLTALDCFAPFVKHVQRIPCQQTQQSSIHPQQPLDAEVVWWVCGNEEGLVRHEAATCKIMQKLHTVHNSIRHHAKIHNTGQRTPLLAGSIRWRPGANEAHAET